MEHLIGATILDITGMEVGSDDVKITTDRGTLRLFHYRDCCETVEIVDVTGDPLGLIGGRIAVAQERVSDPPNDADALRGDMFDPDYDSETWTFYEIRTTREDITIRWLGQSNGYYSESVDIEWTPA